MIVMKFGGSSVANAAALKDAAAIVKTRIEQKPVVVVSAMGDTTDFLADIVKALESGDVVCARRILSALDQAHQEAIAELALADAALNEVRQMVQEVFSRVSRIIDAVEGLGEVSPRSRDAVLGAGELAAGPILAACLKAHGLPAVAVDPRAIIVTNGQHGAAQPLLAETERKCREVLVPLLEAGQTPVAGGYAGATMNGIMTTLGRGGSDLTASILAKVMGATVLEYWKDVDGILTADPRIVDNARPLAEISFREAAELAFLGAQVLHPASIQPAVEAGVPVRVLNSRRPEAPGTMIRERRDEPARPGSPAGAVVAVACKRNQALINIFSTRMLGATGFLRQLFEVFDRLRVSVDHIATSEVNVTMTLGAVERLDELKAALAEVAAVKIEYPVGVVSVVGDRLPSTEGVAARIFGALSDINIRMISYGGTGVNVSLVVSNEHLTRAVRQLHEHLCSPTAIRE